MPGHEAVASIDRSRIFPHGDFQRAFRSRNRIFDRKVLTGVIIVGIDAVPQFTGEEQLSHHAAEDRLVSHVLCKGIVQRGLFFTVVGV